MSNKHPRNQGEMHGVFQSKNLQEILPSSSPDRASKGGQVESKIMPTYWRDKRRLDSSIPSVCSTASGRRNGLRSVQRFPKRQRSDVPTYATWQAAKGYAWPSFNHLAAKLHISRRYVIKLVQELSAHGLIVATSVNVPSKGHCTNHYRFLWHPWVQTVEDGEFRMVVREEKPPFRAAKRPSEQQITSPSEPQITPLVNHRSLP